VEPDPCTFRVCGKKWYEYRGKKRTRATTVRGEKKPLSNRKTIQIIASVILLQSDENITV
jgi:hypothetical protein